MSENTGNEFKGDLIGNSTTNGSPLRGDLQFEQPVVMQQAPIGQTVMFQEQPAVPPMMQEIPAMQQAAAEGKKKKKDKKKEAKQKEVKQKEAKPKEKASKLSIVLIIMAILVLLASTGLILVNLLERNKFNGENWYDGDKKIDTTIDEVEAFENVSDNTSSIADSWEYGKVDGPGTVPYDNDYYYVCNPLHDNKIYKITKDDNHDNTMLSDVPGSYINMIDGKVYFINIYDDSGYDKGIYCVDVDGNETEVLALGLTYNLQIVNDWCYYIDGNDNCLYKMNLFTRRPIKLINSFVTDYVVFENTIYYIEYDESTRYYNINSVDVDGNAKKIVADTGFFADILYSDGYLYVLSNKDSISKINVSTNEFTVLYYGYFVTEIVKIGDLLYFIDDSFDRQLGVIHLTDDYVDYYNVNKVSGLDGIGELLAVYYIKGDTTPATTVNDTITGKAVKFFK